MNQPLQEDLDFLAHFGVKGMRWGVRNNKDSNTPPSPSKRAVKKELKRQTKEDALNAGIKKAEELVSFAAANRNNSLVMLNGRQIVTGEEFVNHMVSGGYLNVKTSSIYAVKDTKDGPYVLQ